MRRVFLLLFASVLAAIGPGLVSPGRAAIGVDLHADGLELDPHGSIWEVWDVDEHAPWSPSEWDGVHLTTDAPDLTRLPTVHAVYVVPSDAPDRFLEYAAMFQADARQASARLTELYGRGIRLDEREGAGGTRYIDITVVRSSATTAELTLPYYEFWQVEADLDDAGLTDPDKKYAVWLDAPSTFCGMATRYTDYGRDGGNANEGRSTAVVFRSATRAVTDADSGGFCRGRVLLHELGHAFGALLPAAPHAFDGAHCSDSAEDVMCYRPPAVADTGGAAFDYGNDDFWDPAANPALGSSAKLPWWTANLSRFICPTSGCDKPNTNPGY